MVYLFSPVGNTDPIKYFRDGSLVHICRVYQPDVVYLYLSKEMMEHHTLDNRYVHTLELLGEKLNHSFDIRLIERPDLVEVHRYDWFYFEFQNELKRIEAMLQPEDQLLVNTASGTPAMKSALNIIAALAEYRFTPIQTSSPKHQSNSELEERASYDPDLEWELDGDNEDGFENRCHEVHSPHLLALMKKDMIRKHLKAYDYRAALAVGEEIRDELPERMLELLRAADARLKLDGEVFAKQQVDNIQAFCPVRDGEKKRLFEYALTLKIKVQKEEYADFIRAVTPLTADLLERVLKRLCRIDIGMYCVERKKKGSNIKVRNWSMDKLQGTQILEWLNDATDGGEFRSGPVYSWALNALIQRSATDRMLKEHVQDLMDIEQSIRNVAAHEAVSITEKWINQVTGFSVEKILNYIFYLCNVAQINTKNDNWNSYDQMNEYIAERL